MLKRVVDLGPNNILTGFALMSIVDGMQSHAGRKLRDASVTQADAAGSATSNGPAAYSSGRKLQQADGSAGQEVRRPMCCAYLYLPDDLLVWHARL